MYDIKKFLSTGFFIICLPLNAAHRVTVDPALVDGIHEKVCLTLKYVHFSDETSRTEYEILATRSLSLLFSAHTPLSFAIITYLDTVSELVENLSICLYGPQSFPPKRTHKLLIQFMDNANNWLDRELEVANLSPLDSELVEALRLSQNLPSQDLAYRSEDKNNTTTPKTNDLIQEINLQLTGKPVEQKEDLDVSREPISLFGVLAALIPLVGNIVSNNLGKYFISRTVKDVLGFVRGTTSDVFTGPSRARYEANKAELQALEKELSKLTTVTNSQVHQVYGNIYEFRKATRSVAQTLNYGKG